MHFDAPVRQDLEFPSCLIHWIRLILGIGKCVRFLRFCDLEMLIEDDDYQMPCVRDFSQLVLFFFRKCGAHAPL